MNQNQVWHYLDLTVQPEWLDAVLNVCWETGSVGSMEETPCSGWHRVFFPAAEQLENARRRIRALFPAEMTGLNISYGYLADPGWRTAWHAFFKPKTVGRSFLVLPSWESIPDTKCKIIKIDPGQAFGTGHHETTALCIQLLESLDLTGCSVLDAGCGSGILGIASVLLGAKSVLGIDIEAEAITEAERNARLNAVHDRCRWRVTDFIQLNGLFDCVIGNLQTDLIRHHALKLTQLTQKSGHLILSGFLVTDKDEVIRIFQELRPEISVSVMESGEWSSVHLTGCKR